MQKNDKKGPAKSTAKPRSKQKTTKELTREHIQKEDHKITDEDFKNVVLGEDLPEDRKEPLDLPNTDDRPHDEDKDHKIATPWDVIK